MDLCGENFVLDFENVELGISRIKLINQWYLRFYNDHSSALDASSRICHICASLLHLFCICVMLYREGVVLLVLKENGNFC